MTEFSSVNCHYFTGKKIILSTIAILIAAYFKNPYYKTALIVLHLTPTISAKIKKK